MRKTKTLSSLLILLALAASPALAGHETSPYMGAPVKLVTAPNGAIINAFVAEEMPKVHPTTPQVRKVTDGVWQLIGMSIVYPTVIEGRTGLIVYDTGDNLEEGKHFLEKIRTISDKPVKAIIYSHAHYVHGAAAIADGNKDVMVIGNPRLNKNIMEGGGLGTAYPELAPLQMARALRQFNNFTPRTGPDAPVAGIIEIKESGFLPVNRPVKDGEELTVDGVKMQFFTKYSSDTDDCLTVWIPEKKVVLNNFVWPFMPNFYTPRGALYRDPYSWIHGLEQIRNLDPEYVISTHTLPIVGKENCRRSVNLYRDGVAFIMDQTLRGILKGLGPDELRHFVVLPDRLKDFPLLSEGYGELQWYPPYFFNYALGWWDGDAGTLYQIAPAEQAARLVKLMGGRDKVIEAAEESLKKHEYAWVTQLTNYILKIDPQDADARRLKATALRQMGYRARGTIMRSYAITEALRLEGKVKVPTVVPPKVSDVAAAPPAFYLNQFRVRVDPAKAQNLDMLMGFVFTDADNARMGLDLRQGVVEFIPDLGRYYKKPDLTLTLDRTSWGEIFTGAKTVKELLDAGAVTVDGSREDAIRFFSVFDQFEVYTGPAKVGNATEEMLSDDVL